MYSTHAAQCSHVGAHAPPLPPSLPQVLLKLQEDLGLPLPWSVVSTHLLNIEGLLEEYARWGPGRLTYTHLQLARSTAPHTCSFPLFLSGSQLISASR